MKSYSLSHLADHVLLIRTRESHAREHCQLAESLSCLAEVQERRLYAGAGYPDMRAWCLAELHLSEGAVYKRLRAARAARRFPQLYEALAKGRLHLSAVVAIEPRLGPENVDELILAATHQTREAVEKMLAERYPRPDLPTRIWLAGGVSAQGPLSPGTVAPSDPSPAQDSPGPLQLATIGTAAMPATPTTTTASLSTPARPSGPPARVTPLAPQRFAFQCTLDHETVDLLRRAQALLGHAMPSGELTQVLKRVLQDWVQAQERRKFGLTGNPRARRSTANGRYVPAELRRQVLQRDGGRCTFVGANGHRCESRTRLEYDHAQPVARGGRTTLENLRLRCRAHNQHEADRVFGAGFMARRRGSARARPARASAKAEVRARPPGLAGA